jgi:hypothetical protein
MSYTEAEESEFMMGHELNSNFSVQNLPSHGGYISGMPIYTGEREAYHREKSKPRKKTSGVRTSQIRTSRIELDDSDAADQSDNSAALAYSGHQTPVLTIKKESVVSKVSKSSANKIKSSPRVINDFLSPRSSHSRKNDEDD